MLTYILNCSQKSKQSSNHSDKPERVKLIGKTFKANVGSMCAETIPLDPCAGSQFDLVLKFNEDVTEEEVSDRGRKIAKNNFKAQWQIKDDVVIIEKLIRYG